MTGVMTMVLMVSVIGKVLYIVRFNECKCSLLVNLSQ